MGQTTVLLNLVTVKLGAIASSPVAGNDSMSFYLPDSGFGAVVELI